MQKNIWNNPAFGDHFAQLLKEFECVEHYLREVEKEIPVVVEEDLKGGIEGRANPQQVELQETKQRVLHLRE